VVSVRIRKFARNVNGNAFYFQGMVPNKNIRFIHAARNFKRAKFNGELKSSFH